MFSISSGYEFVVFDAGPGGGGDDDDDGIGADGDTAGGGRGDSRGKCSPSPSLTSLPTRILPISLSALRLG